ARGRTARAALAPDARPVRPLSDGAVAAVLDELREDAVVHEPLQDRAQVGGVARPREALERALEQLLGLARPARARLEQARARFTGDPREPGSGALGDRLRRARIREELAVAVLRGTELARALALARRREPRRAGAQLVP